MRALSTSSAPRSPYYTKVPLLAPLPYKSRCCFLTLLIAASGMGNLPIPVANMSQYAAYFKYCK